MLPFEKSQAWTPYSELLPTLLSSKLPGQPIKFWTVNCFPMPKFQNPPTVLPKTTDRSCIKWPINLGPASVLVRFLTIAMKTQHDQKNFGEKFISSGSPDYTPWLWFKQPINSTFVWNHRFLFSSGCFNVCSRSLESDTQISNLQ